MGCSTSLSDLSTVLKTVSKNRVSLRDILGYSKICTLHLSTF